MKYIGIHKYLDYNKPPTATYHNIPIKTCYVLFDAMRGDILSLIDISDISNSICVDNNLFKPVGLSEDKLPTTNPIVINVIKHITPDLSGVKILEVDGNDVKYFDSSLTTKDVVSTINSRIRENKINDILDQ